MVVLRVFAKTPERRAEKFLGNDQFRFRRERGTREAIAVVKTLPKRSMEFNQGLFACFMDYEKAA